jgi:hypothetical protein
MDGDVQSVEKALKVTLNKYALDGKQFYSNDRNPVLAPHLIGVVRDVLGLNGLEHFHSLSNPTSDTFTAEPLVSPAPYRIDHDAVRATCGGAAKGPNDGLRPLITGGNPQATNVIEPPDLWSSEAYNFKSPIPARSLL